ncbi:MAG: response regulator [Pseudomonadota bacterium]
MSMSAELNYQENYTPKILVVDDEQRIRDACRMILEEAHYEVHIAADGRQGVKEITENHYDLILLDLMMPNLSGFDVLAQVKADHPETVVIIITGYATLEHSVEAMKKGAFDFIPKPFTPDHLRVVVAKAIGHIMALRDIANTRSRLRTMVNSLSDGVMCTNRQNIAVLANPAFLRMLGCRAGLGAGLSVDDLVENVRVREMIRRTLRLLPASVGELSEEITATGSGDVQEVILSVRCVPFRDRSGTTVGVITVLHDITALRRMDEMKSHFVSMVSHEIRSPMNSVLMQLQVVLDGLAGTITAKQQQILERASKKVESLSQMTSELLDLATIESGLLVQKREPVQLAEVIREQVALVAPQAAAKSIRLSTAVADDLPVVLADRRNMEEVMANLITNAIKYTPDAGVVTVAAAAAAGTLTIRVSDTGFGIADSEKNRVFDRFYRIKNEQTRYIQGTGLGLSIVRGIIDAHDGHIAVEDGPNGGTTFRVSLPVVTS